MAPDWEKLSKEWEGNAVGLVAEVDCTADGKPLCDANGVRGFPTLKYGDPAALDDYQGSRTYSDLAKFAQDNLKPVCSPTNIDLCDADKKKQIEEFMKLSDEDLDAKIKTEEEKLEKAEEEFKDAVTALQEQYQKLSQEKDDKLAEVKAGGLGLLKSVKSAKTKASIKKDEL
jgi:Thioredoxin